MTEPVDLSVVMPTRNKAGLLERTLRALAGQVVPAGTRWEVVVVDDGSTDRTPDALAALSTHFPVPLRIVTAEENVGRARARNLGIAAASGTWILFMDDDIVAPGGLIAAHLGLLASETRVGTIGHAYTEPALIDAPHFYYLDSRGAGRLEAGPAPARFFVTQNAAAPRWALQEVGGFHEGFSAYGFEDMELAFRLEDLCGIRFLAQTSPVPLHIHHHTLQEYLAKKTECGRHSLALLAKLHPRRMQEMKLDLVVDGSGGRGGVWPRLLKGLLDSPLAGLPRWAVAHWPCYRASAPVWRRLYFQVMNLVVLSCFRDGWRLEHDRHSTAI